MTLLQKKWYKALYEKNYEKLARVGGESATKGGLMNICMQLRKCCNHPYLLQGCEASLSPIGTPIEKEYDNLINACGKFVLLNKLLPDLKKKGHRVLIFSQMSRVLDILEDYLRWKDHEFERIDGGVTGNDRQQAIDRFQNNPDIFCFILTTRAGGVGINLMGADTVIIFDSDWNPMNDLQAVARCHRIGQNKKVKVYRFVSSTGYEREMFHRADQKRALNSVVMGKFVDKGKKEIDDLLKKGAVSIFLNEKEVDEDIKTFQQQSIEDILRTRTENVKRDENVNNDSTFSQAVFVADKKDTNVDINDDNFWERIGIKKAFDDKKELQLLMGRQRRRVNYNEDDLFNPFKNHAADSDYDVSDDDNQEDDRNGVLRAIQEYPWGSWDTIYETLSEKEKQFLANKENLKIACIQLIAFVFTASRKKEQNRKFLSNPIVHDFVNDKDFINDVDEELKRTNPEPDQETETTPNNAEKKIEKMEEIKIEKIEEKKSDKNIDAKKK